ncbi:helix-turn-helix domain-containing protein [Streptomyces sp. NPDC049555]|uniref:helix-turn-helix domain-containing protein n=1 Tax=Streptomyces sp. NPDC049555 TaxID=3154930 RepID=UPI00343E4D61
MSGERPLPAECARLAAGLRELKDRTGLSLAALAGRTPYSKSSWERYLNGKKLPPKQAVEALCALAEEPAGRLVALWELAEQAWSGRSAEAGTDAPRGVRTPPGPAERGWRTPVVSGAVAVLALALAVTVFLTTGGSAPGGHDHDGLAATSPYLQYQEPACKGEVCEAADPTRTGCGLEAVTLFKRRAAGGQQVELRYSEKCAAVWGKTQGLHVGDRVELRLPGAGTKTVTAASQRDTETYLSTAMTVTADPHGARVCLLPAGGPQQCFGAA